MSTKSIPRIVRCVGARRAVVLQSSETTTMRRPRNREASTAGATGSQAAGAGCAAATRTAPAMRAAVAPRTRTTPIKPAGGSVRAHDDDANSTAADAPLRLRDANAPYPGADAVVHRDPAHTSTQRAAERPERAGSAHESGCHVDTCRKHGRTGSRMHGAQARPAASCTPRSQARLMRRIARTSRRWSPATAPSQRPIKR
jgi:hypothetical protein